MFINWDLAMLMFVLTLGGQGYTLEHNEVVPHSRPYMVLLEMTESHGGMAHCGGFLLNEDFVMTAAHCQAKSYRVWLGLHDLTKDEKIQIIAVEQAFPHEEYNDSTLINDIMLLKLSSKAHFNENVKPIPLASGDDGSLPKSCRISGWGTDDKKSTNLSHILKEVSVTLINDDTCTEENMWYCSEGKSQPGDGDGGGPLVCEDGKAYGVVSSTIIPYSGDPEIHRYTKIPDYRGWIATTMRNPQMMMVCM